MGSLGKLMGWLVAAVLGVVLVFSLMTPKTEPVSDTESPSASTVEQESDLTSKIAALSAELAEKTKALEEVRQENSDLQERLAEKVMPAEEALSEEEPDAPAEKPSTNEENDGPTQRERIVNQQMSMMAQMTFGDLYKELGLAPETREAMNEQIGNHMALLQQKTQQAMRAKDKTAKDFHAETEAMEADLRAKLSEWMTPEELAAWDAYEPVADQIMYERVVEGQLNMMAVGLSEENRILASQVMAEELVVSFDTFNQTELPYTMDNFNDAQATALNASLERLSGTLKEEQYAQVSGFVQQALAMFDAMKENNGE